MIEKLAALLAVGHPGLAQHRNVAASAKAPTLAMVDDHRFDVVVVAPFQKGVDHPETHVEVERMDHFRPVQADMTDPSGFSDDKIFCHVFPIVGAVPARRSSA